MGRQERKGGASDSNLGASYNAMEADQHWLEAPGAAVSPRSTRARAPQGVQAGRAWIMAVRREVAAADFRGMAPSKGSCGAFSRVPDSPRGRLPVPPPGLRPRAHHAHAKKGHGALA